MLIIYAFPGELHDYMGASKGRSFGMPVDAFIQQTYRELLDGNDYIVIGELPGTDKLREMINERRSGFEKLSKILNPTMAPYTKKEV